LNLLVKFSIKREILLIAHRDFIAGISKRLNQTDLELASLRGVAGIGQKQVALVLIEESILLGPTAFRAALRFPDFKSENPELPEVAGVGLQYARHALVLIPQL